MDASEEFASYKKVIIFGNEGSGKTSLTKRIERGSFTNESHTENCKLKIYNSDLQHMQQVKFQLIINRKH